MGKLKNLSIAAAALALVLTAQTPTPAVYTTAQADAGRTVYEGTCGKCHTPSLLGRTGAAGETPALDTLPAGMQEFVRAAGGQVPALAGADFMTRWKARTTREFSSRIREAAVGFLPRDMDKETYLALTAYVLQVNGARPGAQALTASTAVEIGSITDPAAAH